MKKSNNMHIIIPLYWITLLLWQVFRPVSNHSVIDIGIKILLLGGLLFFVLFKTATNRIDIGLLFLLCVYTLTQLLSLWYGKIGIDFSGLINLFFTFSICFSFYILNVKYVIHTGEMIFLSKIVIGIVTLLCLYTDMFEFNGLRSAIHANSGYGMAISSLLASNHEFGLYLTMGIASCIFLLTKLTIGKRGKGICLLFCVYFLLHLLLTFSRTSLISIFMAVFIWFFVLKKYRLLYSGILVGLFFFTVLNASWRQFFLQIILRVQSDGNRKHLLNEGLHFFFKGSAWDMIFGVGPQRTIKLAEQISINTSFHNAYITVLLSGGIIMFIFLILVLGSSVFNSIKTLKINRVDGTYLLSLNIIMLLYMWAQTPVIFSSDLVSTILTFFCIIIPKYYSNVYLVKKIETGT